jgi:quercetin dioxygenase-like cupin family protein
MNHVERVNLSGTEQGDDLAPLGAVPPCEGWVTGDSAAVASIAGSTGHTSLRFDLDRLQTSGHWQPFRAGIEFLPLHGTIGSGAAAALLRYARGAVLPQHRHTGLEQILVLSGVQSDDAGQYAAGHFVVNLPNSSHRVWSAEGCTVLVYWQSPVVFE